MQELIAVFGTLGIVITALPFLFGLFFFVYVIFALSSIRRDLDYLNQQVKFYGEKLTKTETTEP
jgi:hypothetical protein